MNSKKIDGVDLNIDFLSTITEEQFLENGVSKLFKNQNQDYLRKVYRLALNKTVTKKENQPGNTRTRNRKQE